MGIVITSAACGGNSPASPDAAPAPDAAAQPDAAATPDAAPAPDAAPDAAQPDAAPQGSIITVEALGAPALISYRQGASGSWQTPTATGPTTFTFSADGPFAMMVVCDDGEGLVSVDVTAQAPSDGHALYAGCASPSGPSHDVKGHMAQAGELSLGYELPQSSTTANWDFTVPSPDGVYDLVATTADRIAFRRGVTVNGATTVSPALDLSHEGFDLIATPFTAATPSSEEKVSANVSLNTARAGFIDIFHGDPAKLALAPNAALLATDRQTVFISATLGASSRTVVRDNVREGDAQTVTLPEALEPIQFDAANHTLTAKWSSLPDHDILLLQARAFSPASAPSATARFYAVRATRAYELATGTNTLEIDTTAPGFKPEWRIDYADDHYRSFSVTRFRTNGDDASSDWQENIHTRTDVANASSRKAADRTSLARALRQGCARGPAPYACLRRRLGSR